MSKERSWKNLNAVTFDVSHLENRKLPFCSLQITEFYILRLSNEFCSVLSYPQIKNRAKIALHYSTRILHEFN